MAWGHWFVRAASIALIWGGVNSIAIVDPKFVQQAGASLFGRYLASPTSQFGAFYALIFGIGTLLAFMAIRSIRSDAMEEVG